MRLPRRVRRALNSMWFMRVGILAAIGVQGSILVTTDSLLWRVVAVVFILGMLAAWTTTEHRHRDAVQTRWAAAAASGDPVLFLARSEFTRDLSLREHMRLANWQVAHGVEHEWRPPTEEEIAAAPQVVKDYYRVGTNPPADRPGDTPGSTPGEPR